MIKIGLIGAGWHAQADHAPALRHCADEDEFRGRVELSGVCDIDVARAKDATARFGFRRHYDSIDAMLPNVDVVLCIIPPAAMAESLPTIVRHRRPVLIEKPLGRDLNEARHIAQMLDNHPHMVSLNRRFDPAVQIARKWLAGRSPPRMTFGVMRRRNRHERDFTWSTAIHLTDLMCHLAGPLELGHDFRHGSHRIATLAGAGRLLGTIELTPTADDVAEIVHLSGDGWAIGIWTGAHEPWRVITKSRVVAEELDVGADPNMPSYVRNGTVNETAAFLRSVLTGRMPGPTVADAMPGTQLAAAMQRIE